MVTQVGFFAKEVLIEAWRFGDWQRGKSSSLFNATGTPIGDVLWWRDVCC